jgi:hypothetical protein
VGVGGDALAERAERAEKAESAERLEVAYLLLLARNLEMLTAEE